jgi:seryl-tRNA synthetase
MGFTDAKQFDIEAWIPSEGRYRETHSCSNTTDFQARGINAKYRVTRDTGHGTNYVHMLNATGITPRALIAILENCQTKKGTVKVPKVLAKYAGVKEIKAR